MQATFRIPLLVAASYWALFLLFDWASFIRPFQGLNITPWNPQPALAIALLLWNRRWLWVVWIGLLTAELVVRGAPADWLTTLCSTAALSLIYAATAHALAQRLDRSLFLANRRDLIWLTLTVFAGGLLSGIIYVAVFTVAGLGPTGSLLEAIARYWIGDTVGIMVVLPMLLVLTDRRRRAGLYAALADWQWWLIAILIALLVLVVFSRGEHDQFKYFYLLLLPVVWGAASLGVAGAVLSAGLTQLGLIVAVQVVPNRDLTVFELQMLMTAITMTGLLLGVAVDERARVAAELRGSLRLAAAGQMAAALGHELSQPLTALSSYAQAVRLLVAEPSALGPREREQLMMVSTRLVGDAHRASEVVKRLRDFFRSGTTQLRAVSPDWLASESMTAQAQRAQALGTHLESHVAADLPEVWMDPIQIGVVMRNLISNALDAVAELGDQGRVSIQVAQIENALQFCVADNGPGIPSTRLETVFDSDPSDKPGGMGVGLGICRAIIEAHGGRLWAQAGPGGQFCFTLALDPTQLPRSRHAA